MTSPELVEGSNTAIRIEPRSTFTRIFAIRLTASVGDAVEELAKKNSVKASDVIRTAVVRLIDDTTPKSEDRE